MSTGSYVQIIVESEVVTACSYSCYLHHYHCCNSTYLSLKYRSCLHYF